MIGGGFDGSHGLSSVLTLLRGATAWTPLASLPHPLRLTQASLVGGRLRVAGGFDGSSYRSEVMFNDSATDFLIKKMNTISSLLCVWQVLEYHHEPWDKWVSVGSILVARRSHGALSIGLQELPCLSGQAGHMDNQISLKTKLIQLNHTY